MTSASLTALVAALLSLAIGLSVYLEDRRRPVYRAFAIVGLNLFAYHVSNFVALTLADSAAQLISYLAALAIPITLVRFFGMFLEDEPSDSSSGWTAPAIGLAVVLSGVLVYLSFVPNPSLLLWFRAATFTFVLAAGGVCVWEIFRKYKTANVEVDRTRLMYLGWGLVVTLALLVVANLPWAKGTLFEPLGILLATLYFYFLSQNLFQYRLLDLQEVLARVSILAAMVLILSAIYGALLAWIEPGQTGLFILNTIIGSVIVLILVDPLRSAIEDWVNRYLFRQRHELGQNLLQLNRMIRHVVDLNELWSLVKRSLESSRRVTHSAIFIAAEDGSRFNLRGSLGPSPPEQIDAVTNSSFFEQLRSSGMLVLDQLVLEREAARRGWGGTVTSDQHRDATIRTMEEIGAGVCFALMSEDQLLGMLTIQDDRIREAFSSYELELFKSLAGQIAITLVNSRIYAAMQERDRLAVLGEMSAGMAHEIRNPLGAIKGAAQYLHSLPETEEGEGDVQEFLGIIIEEVDRLNRVVSQFLDYARPDRGERQMLQINDVVTRSVQLLEQENADGKVDISLELAEHLPETRGDPEQLHQVFLNLGINALQAMPEGGRLTVSSRVVRRPRGRVPGPWLEVSFQDTGEGIEARQLNNLFVPFFTTKGGGTGLGLPISQRIAENHGGTIFVHSTRGSGSTFTLSVPQTTSDTMS